MSVVPSSVVAMTSRTTIAEAPVITRARAALELKLQAAALELATAAEWAESNTALFEGDVAFGEETGLPLAGPGAPLVAEFAVVQYATVLGLTQHSGRALIGDALELKHRLPRCWARVQQLEVPAWKARRLAERTRLLSPEAAAFVDAQLAPFLHGLGWAQQERTLSEAIERFMPGHAEELREQAAEGRHVDVLHDGGNYEGVSTIMAVVDTPDAVDFDAAISARAAERLRLGSDESLDVRRAKALGELARDDLALDLPATTRTEARPKRQAVLYLHLDPSGETGHLEGKGLVTAETIREWLGAAGTQVTVRPVIDLNATLATDSYAPTPVMREQAMLINPTCVFPYCNRDSRSCDLDHVVSWDVGGQTVTLNLAPLCRLHHRVKTHDDWTYRPIRPGLYEWTDPMGHRFLVDNRGVTTHLGPPILDPRDPHPPDG